MSPTEPHIPAFSSYAPNTSRPTFASTIAPAHCAHGSSVTYSVQSVSRSAARARRAFWMASSSACAVGSRRVTVSLCARASDWPFRNTAAPTGTSPADAARRASSSAAVMPSISAGGTGRLGPFPLPPSPAFSRTLRTCRLGCPGGDALKGDVHPVLRAVHPHPIPFHVLPLEHREGQRVLEQPLDGALQRPGPVHRVVSLGDDQLLRPGRHLEAGLAIGQQPSEAADLQVHDLADVISRQRPEDDHVVHPV